MNSNVEKCDRARGMMIFDNDRSVSLISGPPVITTMMKVMRIMMIIRFEEIRAEFQT